MRVHRGTVIRLAAVAAMLGLGLAALWHLLARLLYTDRGLDLTDEGLYLLAADPPSDTAAWVVPFGWHTRWLFDLVGHDIADFRTAAAVIIVVLGAVTGHAVSRHVQIRSNSEERPDAFAMAISATIGGVAGLLLFAGLLRTPGYNWVNLVGLFVAATATVGTRWSPTPSHPYRNWRYHLGGAGIAGGATISLVAKPTSGPGVLALAVLFIAFTSGRRAALAAALTTIMWSAVWVLLALASGLWPASFGRVLAGSAEFPVPLENQQPRAAVIDALRLPVSIWESLRGQPIPIQAIVAVALVATAVSIAWKRAGNWVTWAPLACCSFAALCVALPLSERYRGFGSAQTSTWLWTLLAGAGLHLLTMCSRNERQPGASWAVPSLLIGFVMLFSIGSGQGTFRQSGLCAALIVLAAMAMAGSVGGKTMRRAGVAATALAGITCSIAALTSSFDSPYRIASVDQLDQRVEVTSDRSALFVDRETAALFAALETNASAGGWCPGTRLLGVAWPWSSTIPFVLDATTPETLMVTIFGYPTSNAIAVHTTAKLDATWRKAWILRSDPSALDSVQRGIVNDAIDVIATHLEITFPDDYELAATAGSLQLWRPAVSAMKDCQR